MHICYWLNAWNECWDQPTDMALNKWYKLKIRQRKEDQEIEAGVVHGVVHVYEIFLDGVRVYSVINTTPTEYTGVKVSMCDNRYSPPTGKYRNFVFNPDKPAMTGTPHTINPNLNQLFIDQYRFWSNFRHRDTGFYCDGQHTTSQSDCAWFFSSASTGWGLMIDVIAAEVGLISKQGSKFGSHYLN